VELLGHRGKLKWSQSEAGLQVTMPAERPCDYAVALKIAT
jgi:alpha-L-fucosidase